MNVMPFLAHNFIFIITEIIRYSAFHPINT